MGSTRNTKRRQDKRLARAQMTGSRGGGNEERPQKNRGGSKLGFKEQGMRDGRLTVLRVAGNG